MANEPPQLLTEEAIAEIEARANAATEGPWEYTPFAISLPNIGGPLKSLIVELPDHVRPLTERQAIQCEADYKFMAHARTDIPALCQTLRAAWAEINEKLIQLAALREQLGRIEKERDYWRERATEASRAVEKWYHERY